MIDLCSSCPAVLDMATMKLPYSFVKPDCEIVKMFTKVRPTRYGPSRCWVPREEDRGKLMSLAHAFSLAPCTLNALTWPFLEEGKSLSFLVLAGACIVLLLSFFLHGYNVTLFVHPRRKSKTLCLTSTIFLTNFQAKLWPYRKF